MSGQLENNTRQHVGMPPSFIIGHGCMDHLTNKRSFDSQDTWVIDVLGFQKNVIHGYLYKQALADVRSSGAGLKYLYCSK